MLSVVYICICFREWGGVQCKCCPWSLEYLSLTSSLSQFVGKNWKYTRNITLQPQIGFNSGKYDQIFPVVSERTQAFFQAMERRAAHKHGCRPDYVSTAWHWLQMHILESPVKLLVCCLYQCFVSLVEQQPALGKVHAKSITQFLSVFFVKERLTASLYSSV